jgi:hypothetical protein
LKRRLDRSRRIYAAPTGRSVSRCRAPCTPSRPSRVPGARVRRAPGPGRGSLGAPPLAHARDIASAAFWPAAGRRRARPASPVGLGVPDDEEPPPLRWLVHGIVAGRRPAPGPCARYPIPDHAYVKLRIPLQGPVLPGQALSFLSLPPSSRGAGRVRAASGARLQRPK